MWIEPTSAPPSSASPSAELSGQSAGAVSALRALSLSAEGLQAFSPYETLPYAGVSISAVSGVGTLVFQRDGLLSDSSWSWSSGPVFAGANGVLTQTPQGGWLVSQVVGVAVSATKLELQRREPVYG